MSFTSSTANGVFTAELVKMQGKLKIGKAVFLVDRQPAHLSWITIHWPWRGKGYGRQLFERALGELHQHGHSHVELDALPTAQGFYDRLPYCRRIPFHGGSVLIPFVCRTDLQPINIT